mmetsp:Transcript_32277/g.74564  ORF Transcript_32277/g.74564 Transcript_32277/m.74564 type:complete len:292 (-) Transcript_32277:38-913(-)
MWSQQIGHVRANDTTIIMRGVHRQHSIGVFSSLLQETCSKSPQIAFNFAYLPCARDDECVNLGLAFVNFETPASCKMFLEVLKSETAGQFYVRFAGRASLQGRSMNLLHLLKTRGHEGLLGPGAPRVYRAGQRVPLAEILFSELPKIELSHVPWAKVLEDELMRERGIQQDFNGSTGEEEVDSRPLSPCSPMGPMGPMLITSRLASVEVDPIEMAKRSDPSLVFARLAALKVMQKLPTTVSSLPEYLPYAHSVAPLPPQIAIRQIGKRQMAFAPPGLTMAVPFPGGESICL